MKLYDINLDCLRSLLENLPLEKRLFTLRQVNSQWKTTVEDICKTQTELTLQIGSGNQWEKIVESVKSRNLLVNAVSPFHNLTAAHLTDELTTFLISTFPRLQSLAIVVENKMTETVDFLHYLPRLISAFSSTLTTLQLVWRVRNDTFQAVFSSLIGSINGLRQLKRLSFYDDAGCLKVPTFDLPHLMSTSLETLDLYFYKSSVDFARHWEGSLQARQSSKASCKLMQINYMPSFPASEELPISHLFPANVAVHFHSMFLYPKTVADLEHLGSGAFNNLHSLHLLIWNVTLSVGDVLVQLARLPHLTNLTLWPADLTKIDYPANRPLPVLPVVRRLQLLALHSTESLHDQVNTEALRLCQVFPNLLTINLTLCDDGCVSCGWQKMWSEDSDKFQMAKGSERLVEQCATRLATQFVSGKSKPRVKVCFRVMGTHNLVYTVDFDDQGSAKYLLTKHVSAK